MNKQKEVLRYDTETCLGFLRVLAQLPYLRFKPLTCKREVKYLKILVSHENLL